MDRHNGQERRVSNKPYFSHPLSVSILVATHKTSKHLDELVAASLLHDTLEDTDTNFDELSEEFTPLVASLVLELTSDEEMIKKMGKNEYMKVKLTGMSSYALVIKLADRLHNISDAPTKKMKRDTLELMSHLIESRKLSKTHMTLIEMIREKLSN